MSYFNTSHVTVYRWSDWPKVMIIRYFNTSHVTVYPFVAVGICNHKWFQYISCYCLSKKPFWNNTTTIISIHLMLLFILHASIAAVISSVISIHLMLLFIVHRCHSSKNLNTYFNTSHVTVYHNMCQNLLSFQKFQYISCYCLSRRSKIRRWYNHISIHLMLLFIVNSGI